MFQENSYSVKDKQSQAVVKGGKARFYSVITITVGERPQCKLSSTLPKQEARDF